MHSVVIGFVLIVDIFIATILYKFVRIFLTSRRETLIEEFSMDGLGRFIKKTAIWGFLYLATAVFTTRLVDTLLFSKTVG